MTFSEHFEAQMMQAIVKQFFENPPTNGTMPDGTFINIPPRPTPAQAVVAQLLSTKNAELLDAIVEAIDLDVLAASVASNVVETLNTPEPRYGWSHSDPARDVRKQLKERVDSRLVELMAQDMYARMMADEGQES